MLGKKLHFYADMCIKLIFKIDVKFNLINDYYNITSHDNNCLLPNVNKVFTIGTYIGIYMCINSLLYCRDSKIQCL